MSVDTSRVRQSIAVRQDRTRALKSGKLIDVSAEAVQAGFRYPVAITRTAWLECVAWSSEKAKAAAPEQNEAARLRDLLYTARAAASRPMQYAHCVFSLHCIPQEGAETGTRRMVLVMQINRNDKGAPVVTILVPGED
ncbi:DUF6573 family protein [Variovorax ureilyticus]|uniref:DUF6573 family protein n=1 Tax=Variovorax ureilyticus TaxID=1836198 RepID=UPI003D677ED3